jgi:HEAT repeat protein
MMRLEAAKRAKQYDDPRMAAAAATLLSDDSAEIRYYAAVSLQTIGSANEVPVLIATLNDEDDDVRLAAVDALGILRDERAVDPLIMMLETEPQPYSVIWALGNTGGDKALDALAPLLESDDRYISYGASRALLKIR